MGSFIWSQRSAFSFHLYPAYNTVRVNVFYAVLTFRIAEIFLSWSLWASSNCFQQPQKGERVCQH